MLPPSKLTPSHTTIFHSNPLNFICCIPFHALHYAKRCAALQCNSLQQYWRPFHPFTSYNPYLKSVHPPYFWVSHFVIFLGVPFRIQYFGCPFPLVWVSFPSFLPHFKSVHPPYFWVSHFAYPISHNILGVLFRFSAFPLFHCFASLTLFHGYDGYI